MEVAESELPDSHGLVPGTFWLSAENAVALTDATRRYLRDLVPEGRGSELVARLERHLEFAQVTKSSRQPMGAVRTDLKKIADQAANLASTLEQLSPASMVALRTQSMHAPRGSLLGELEDVGIYFKTDSLYVFKLALVELANMCEAAAAEMEVGRNVRPSLALSRGIVRQVALDYFSLTKRLPPRGRASWTVQFFAGLKECLGPDWSITLGGDIVDKTIADLDKEMRSQPG